MASSVLCGNLKLHFRYIECDNPCPGRVCGDRDCDSARAGADVENRRGGIRGPFANGPYSREIREAFSFAQKIQRGFDHGLGLWTRDEHTGTHREFERKELPMADDI